MRPIDLSDASPLTSGASQRAMGPCFRAYAGSSFHASSLLHIRRPCASASGAPATTRAARPCARPPSLLACASEHCRCGCILVCLRQPSGADPTPPHELRPSTGAPHLPRRRTSSASLSCTPRRPYAAVARADVPRGQIRPPAGSGPTLCRGAGGSYIFWPLLSLLASLSGFPAAPKLERSHSLPFGWWSSETAPGAGPGAIPNGPEEGRRGRRATNVAHGKYPHMCFRRF